MQWMQNSGNTPQHRPALFFGDVKEPRSVAGNESAEMLLDYGIFSGSKGWVYKEDTQTKFEHMAPPNERGKVFKEASEAFLKRQLISASLSNSYKKNQEYESGAKGEGRRNSYVTFGGSQATTAASATSSFPGQSGLLTFGSRDREPFNHSLIVTPKDDDDCFGSKCMDPPPILTEDFLDSMCATNDKEWLEEVIDQFPTAQDIDWWNEAPMVRLDSTEAQQPDCRTRSASRGSTLVFTDQTLSKTNWGGYGLSYHETSLGHGKGPEEPGATSPCGSTDIPSDDGHHTVKDVLAPRATNLSGLSVPMPRLNCFEGVGNGSWAQRGYVGTNSQRSGSLSGVANDYLVARRQDGLGQPCSSEPHIAGIVSTGGCTSPTAHSYSLTQNSPCPSIAGHSYSLTHTSSPTSPHGGSRLTTREIGTQTSSSALYQPPPPEGVYEDRTINPSSSASPLLALNNRKSSRSGFMDIGTPTAGMQQATFSYPSPPPPAPPMATMSCELGPKSPTAKSATRRKSFEMPHSPTLLALGAAVTRKTNYNDDHDRMVYISWIPKQSRAYTALDRRRMELELKRKLREDLHLEGITKVLLFPPKGAHCKLIFDKRSSAEKFMEKYGGDDGSPASERWKLDICTAFGIVVNERFSKTVVKIEWSQK